jgi:hypothetical protein
METKRELRTFGIGLTIFFLLVGSLLYLRGNSTFSWWFFPMGGLTILIALLLPALLAPIHRIMARFARTIGWINTMALLSIMFYGVFTPVGVVLRLLGKDSLDRKWDNEALSYWHRRDKAGFIEERYERQF